MAADFEWEDECYFLDFLNPSLHALLTVDPAKLVDPDRVNARRTGELFGHAMPLSWTLETGKSRRFYTALGHKKEDYANPILYSHIRGGILWTLGR
jgi:type 1 glutamine amidotransferase